MNDLSQLRICVEKDHHMRHLKKYANSEHHYKHLRAIFMKSKIWDMKQMGNKITYQFLNDGKGTNSPSWTPLEVLENYGTNLDPLEIKLRNENADPITVVSTVLRERIAPMVGFDIVILDSSSNEKGNVRINFDNTKGSYSYIGSDSIQNFAEDITVNYGWLDIGTVIHELCHSLGMVHEHQSPFGNEIEWNESVVYEWASETQGWDKETTKNNILDKYDATLLNGSQYDPESVMLYFYPPALTLNNKGTSLNTRLSATDVEWVFKMYPGSSKFRDAKEYYETIYGKGSYHISKSGKSNKSENKTFMIIIIIIIALLLLVAVVYLFKNRRKIVPRLYKYSN